VVDFLQEAVGRYAATMRLPQNRKFAYFGRENGEIYTEKLIFAAHPVQCGSGDLNARREGPISSIAPLQPIGRGGWWAWKPIRNHVIRRQAQL